MCQRWESQWEPCFRLTENWTLMHYLLRYTNILSKEDLRGMFSSLFCTNSWCDSQLWTVYLFATILLNMWTRAPLTIWTRLLRDVSSGRHSQKLCHPLSTQTPFLKTLVTRGRAEREHEDGVCWPSQFLDVCLINVCLIPRWVFN